jgi:hypothetical protein
MAHVSNIRKTPSTVGIANMNKWNPKHPKTHTHTHIIRSINSVQIYLNYFHNEKPK